MADGNALVTYDTIVDPSTGKTIRVPSIVVHPPNTATTTTPARNAPPTTPMPAQPVQQGNPPSSNALVLTQPVQQSNAPSANALVRLAQPNEVNDSVTGGIRMLDNSEFSPQSARDPTQALSDAALSQALENKASAARIGGATRMGPDNVPVKADGATILDYLHTMLRMPQAMATGVANMVQSGATLPGDVAAGKVPAYGDTGELNPELIQRSLDLTGLMASGTFGGVPEGAIGSGAVRPIIKSKTGQEFQITKEPYIDDRTIYKAVDDEGNEVGMAITGGQRSKNYVTDVGVKKPYRRQGIATGLYDFIEKDTGQKLQPATYQTDEGKAFWKSRGTDLFAGGKGSAPVAGLIASDRLAPPFYSTLDRAVESAPLAKAPAEQWLGTLQNMPGVKGEEFDWRGLGQYLNDNKGKVLTKQDVMGRLSQNPVEVKEVMKGGAQTYGQSQFAEDEADSLLDNWHQNFEEENGRPATIDESAAARQEIIDDIRANPADYDAEEGVRGTKYSEYQLPGGDNYREMLFTLPTDKGSPTRQQFRLLDAEGNVQGAGDVTVAQRWRDRGLQPGQQIVQLQVPDIQAAERQGLFQSSHWDEPNVLAHVRMNDREISDASGSPQKTLFLEELQSDWHQKGRKEGYKGVNQPFDQAAAEKRFEELGYKFGSGRQPYTLAGEHVRPNDLPLEARTVFDSLINGSASNYSMVPDAPFKKTWPDMVLRRMVREAAEKGYDQIAWTDGATQADRYDLSKKIRSVMAFKNEDGTFHVEAMPQGARGDYDNIHLGDRLTKEQLVDNVGKELADKIASQEGPAHTYAGGDLRVGGEGMKAFYDQELPRRATKLFGKLGGKVEKKPMGQEGFDEYGPDYEKEGGIFTHVLRITPQMRDAALHQGFPLFSSGVPLPTSQPTVNRDYDVPAFAGSSNDAGTVYIDRHVPRSINIDGKSVDIAPFLATHETTEHKLMVEDGLSYADAHKQATAAERAQVEAAGIDWKSYEAHINGMLRTIEQEKLARTPPDLYLKPYHSADWGDKEQDIMRHRDQRNTHKLVPVSYNPFAKGEGNGS